VLSIRSPEGKGPLQGNATALLREHVTSHRKPKAIRRKSLERLDRTADFNSPWIASLRDTLVQRIAEQEGSTIENVLVSGTLSKSGAVARCIVRVRKVSNPKLNVTEYVRAEVALAPPNLPDGDYQMHFEARSVKVKKAAGDWSPTHFIQVAYERAAPLAGESLP